MARRSTTSLLLFGFVVGAGCSSSGVGFSGSASSNQGPGANGQQPPGNGQAPPGNGQSPSGTPAICSELCQRISSVCPTNCTEFVSECSQTLGGLDACRAETLALARCLLGAAAVFCDEVDQGQDAPPRRQGGFRLNQVSACRAEVERWRSCTGEGEGSGGSGQGGEGGFGGVPGDGAVGAGGDGAAGTPGDGAAGSDAGGGDAGACVAGVNCSGCAGCVEQCYCENASDPMPCASMCP